MLTPQEQEFFSHMDGKVFEWIQDYYYKNYYQYPESNPISDIVNLTSERIKR